MDFADPIDGRIKFEEREMKDKYVDLAKELKKTNKQWNMKVAVIPIIISALGTITKVLEQGLEDL